MGQRGPIKPGAKRTSGVKTKTSGDVLTPSAYLSVLAKKYWKQLTAAFPAGHFTESDRVLLEQFCTAAAVHQETTSYLAGPSEGGDSRRYFTDRYGKTSLHPAVKDQHQARCDCAMLATKLRITKTSMITPKAAGRAAYDGAAVGLTGNQFGDLLFSNDVVKQ